MPVEGRLVGEHVHVVVVDVHAIGHLLDDDAASSVADEPVQERLGTLGIVGGDEGNVGQCLLDLVDGVEVAGDPQREFAGEDVDTAVLRFRGERCVTGEVQAGDGQPGFVRAVEVHGHAAHFHADADYRTVALAVDVAVCVVAGESAGRDQNGFAV